MERCDRRLYAICEGVFCPAPYQSLTYSPQRGHHHPMGIQDRRPSTCRRTWARYIWEAHLVQ